MKLVYKSLNHLSGSRDGGHSYIDFVKQKAYLKDDESSSEEVAVTIVIIKIWSSIINLSYKMYANDLYLIMLKIKELSACNDELFMVKSKKPNLV